MKVREFLIQSKVFPNLKGFNYIISAVEMVQKNGRIATTKDLYPEIAKQFNTTSSKVERAIRFIVTSKISNKDYEKIGILKKQEKL